MSFNCWYSPQNVSSRRTRRPQAGCAGMKAARVSSVVDKRNFELIPYGKEYSGESNKTITCDGLVPGAALQLTHWTGNSTPDKFYADTSTEIALNFVSSPEAHDWEDAVVLNNHFDTDGVLSAWALLEPEEALRRKKLLVDAAEAGDFNEWPSDEGVWVDAAFAAIRELVGSDKEAYREIFLQLPELLDNIGDRRDLWGPVQDDIDTATEALDAGLVTCQQHGSVGIVIHSPGVPQMPGPVLSKLWRDNSEVRRYLLAFKEESDDSSYRFRYMCPGHAWVARTIVRPRIPVPDGEVMISELGPDWQGLAGLTGIVESVGAVQLSVPAAADLLLQADPSI